MKLIKPLLETIFILVISLLSLTLYSFIDFKIEFGVKIKKAPIKAFFLPSKSTPFLQDVVDKQLAIIIDSTFKVSQQKGIDSSKHKILLTGDSMCEGLMFRFKDYAKYNNHELKTVICYSTTTVWWDETDSLKKMIKKFEPDYIFFTTGSNELFIRNIEEREKHIKDIVRQAGNKKFIWIGPPNWAEDTGINKLIEKNVGKDRFFISKDLEFERASDGAHPTWSSAAVWADTISSWVMQKSRDRILMKKPPKKEN